MKNLVYSLILLLCLSSCCVNRGGQVVPPIQEGDSVTMLINGERITFVRITTDPNVKLPDITPAKPKGSFINVNVTKDKSKTTTVNGNGNTVGDKNKDKAADQIATGDGIDQNQQNDNKAPVADDGGKARQSKGIPAGVIYGVLILLFVAIVAYVIRKFSLLDLLFKK
jgi:hypothetical protein